MPVKLNASSRIMYEAAQALGIECTTFGDSETILMKQGSKQWYTRGSRTSLQSSVGKTIADQKALTKAVLLHHNLPTAKGIKIKNVSDLATAFTTLKPPFVLKPLNSKHGKDVFVGIKTVEEATAIFSKHNDTMLAEEMLRGIEFRVICVNYRFVAAAFRKPAHVVGDNVHTVSELIEIKNQHPWRGEGHAQNLSLIKVDDTVEALLQAQGISLASIPAQDQEVLLRKTANLSTGGEAWDVSADVCEQNKLLFEQIAKACDLNVAGIDIMCQSLKEPIISQVSAGVIEVNASPGLRMHHYPIKGTPVDVASKILEMIIG